jgi:hypothetical protein
MLRSRAFDVSPEAAARIAADIDRIANLLRQQIVWDRDEAAVVAIVRHWSDADERLGPEAGTPHLDRLLLAARTRAYARATARSGFMEQWAILYDDLFRELEGVRLMEFEALAKRSAIYVGPPGSAEEPENFWRTMSRKEAVAVWGILKGMGTSLAGTVDAGARGVTKLMRKAGLDVADPVAAAAWLAEQYDFVGNELIGREEWSEGEELFWGMNAAEVSTHGGEAIWLLVSMGRGDASRVGSQWTQASKWAQVVEKGIGVSGNLMAVEQSANEIVALLEAQQRTRGQLVAASLLQDPAFHKALLRLVANAFGAAASDSDKARRIGALLEGAQITPIVGQLIEIGTADLPTDEKKRRAGPVLMDLMKQVIAAAGAVKAAKPHSDGGNLPPEAEGVPKPPHQPPAEERAVLPKPEPEPKPVAEPTPAKAVESVETPEAKLQRRMRELKQAQLTPRQQALLQLGEALQPRPKATPAEVPSAAVIDAMQGQGVTRPEKRVGIEAALPVAQPPEIRAMAGGMRESPPSSGERVVILEAPASQPTPAATSDQPSSAAELESMRAAYTRMGPEDPAPVSEVTTPLNNHPDIVAFDVPTATSVTSVVKRPLGKAALPEPAVPTATAEPHTSGPELDLGRRFYPDRAEPAFDPNERALKPSSDPPLELDLARDGAAQPLSAPDLNMRELEQASDGPVPKLYKGKRFITDVVGRAPQTHGQGSDEHAGTHRRTGMEFGTLNAAEIAGGLRVDYDPVAGRPHEVRYRVDADTDARTVQTDRAFARDNTTQGAQATDADYTDTGLDRGHLAQREAFKGDVDVERAADLMTNVVPMAPNLNRGAGSPWRAAEAATIVLAATHGHVEVIVTPIYDAAPPTLANGTPIPREIRRQVIAPDGQVLHDVTLPNR